MELHVVEDGGGGVIGLIEFWKCKMQTPFKHHQHQPLGCTWGDASMHLVFFSFSCLSPLLCHADYSLPNTCKPNLGYLLFVRVYLHLK